MKYLITGGAGYKGVKIAGALLARGDEVTIADTFYFGYESVLHLAAHPKLTIVRRDIRDRLDDLVARQDVVIHLAGLSGFPACNANPSVAAAVNTKASERLAKSLSPDQRLIFASTTAMYEIGRGLGAMDESTPVEPIGLYTATKLAAETACLNEHANTVSLRIATVMGVSPRMRSNLLVNDFVHRAVTDRALVLYMPDAKRTFIHIDDCVRGYLMAADEPEMSGSIWNLGRESLNYSKRQIAEAIKAQTDCEVIISEKPDKDVRDFTISFAKIRALGFECQKTLDGTIAELVKLYQFYRPAVESNVL